MSEYCPNCGADIYSEICLLEPDDNSVIEDAAWGRHPTYESEGECPQCHSKFKVSFDTLVSVDISVTDITIDDPLDVPKEVIDAFFKQTPSQFVFAHDTRCEHCRAHLSIQKKTAKEVMDNGMRVAMEFPAPRVTCQKCAAN
ncbi:hypothetical protein [Pseudodesulfovibrio karagichevae]|uniref:Uncharacterized protein n=1 Tax=Pseudodesulfovibrio karagichevae TaxID=3239305 RepID=A0ABV4K344_9BACT